jgi:NADPH-dependent curcumin reductase CurA
VLLRNLWLSVDPAQRTLMMCDSYKPKVPLGEVMQCFAVGQVLESHHPDFKADAVIGEVKHDFKFAVIASYHSRIAMVSEAEIYS